MSPQPEIISAQKAEKRDLASLITELYIARRNKSAYPQDHPVIAASLEKVLRSYENLVHEHDEIILGVTNEGLMANGIILEKSNIIYKNFSRLLFERGIAALLFHSGITARELDNFIAILALKREDIQQYGGIEQLWANAGITAMTIRPIRYDLFTASDQDSITAAQSSIQADSVWDTFARKLRLGGLTPEEGGEADFSPEILARILNQRFVEGGIDESDVCAAIACFFENEDGNSFSEIHTPEPYRKLADVISNLSPELRRQFLNSSFSAIHPERHAAIELILGSLSDNAIIEALDDISHDRLSVSPVVFGLLQRFGANAGSQQNRREEDTEDNEISHKMKTILREHSSEEFVPDSYQKKLNKIIASDHIFNRNLEDVSTLLTTMESRAVEGSIGNILMNMIREGVESPAERDMLLQNLTDMFGFFLQTGDYSQLHVMIDQLKDGTFPVEIQYRLREEYGRREFLEEILDGLTVWGKPCYDDIRALIIKIGGPFVEAVLDRLSEEKKMSIRRLYIDCLIALGPVSRVPILNRLKSETHWYFLRNMLIILSSQKDPSIVGRIRPLLKSEDPRLRHEVLKTLVHFHDPHAEQLLLDNLNSQNQELQVTAIQLAERCDSPIIVAKLTAMLVQGGYSQSECTIKSTIVHTLGESRRVEVLPELARILRSRSLLHSRQLTKLKSDIIHSLPKYPLLFSRPVLELIAKNSGKIGRLAAETLRIISGKSS
ncbi:MAG TPA: HEAT repeat domain-containing protein [Desulfuromonadales bacterium]|nr:HEAT repeat domain-containing protein [Desulfuromonadales bacterium]